METISGFDKDVEYKISTKINIMPITSNGYSQHVSLITVLFKTASNKGSAQWYV